MTLVVNPNLTHTNRSSQEEEEARRERVRETRVREKALQDKRKDGLKMTDLDRAKLLKWKADREAVRFFEEQAAEERDVNKSNAVYVQKMSERAAVGRAKGKKESREMNAAMAAIHEKMVLEKGLHEEAERKQAQEAKKREAVLGRKREEKEWKKRGEGGKR